MVGDTLLRWHKSRHKLILSTSWTLYFQNTLAFSAQLSYWSDGIGSNFLSSASANLDVVTSALLVLITVRYRSCKIQVVLVVVLLVGPSTVVGLLYGFS